MRFRATLASLLAVILLSFPSAGSACEIRCDQASQEVSCHAGMKHSSQPNSGSMASMPGMDTRPAADATPDLAMVSGIAQSCVQHVCAPQPALINARSLSLTNGHLSHQALLLSELPPEYVAPRWMIPLRGPPFIHRASPISLRPTLRV